MWIFRTHNIGSPYKVCYRKVRNKYNFEIEQGVLPTYNEMEEWISRKMPERPHEATFSVQASDEMVEASTVQNSMDSYYDNITRGDEVRCVGVRTRKRIKCVICQSSKFSKVRVSCGHIFHRKCIDEWLRWSKDNTCPTCLVPVDIAKNE